MAEEGKEELGSSGLRRYFRMTDMKRQMVLTTTASYLFNLVYRFGKAKRREMDRLLFYHGEFCNWN